MILLLIVAAMQVMAYSTALTMAYVQLQSVALDGQLLLEQEVELRIAATMLEIGSNPGFRKYWGEARQHNDGFYESVLRMMALNPWQFREKFRMWPATFFSFEADLWDHVFPTYAPLSQLRHPDPNVREAAQKKRMRRWHGPHPDPELFRWRLLATIYFLAAGCSYGVLSDVWGCDIDWGDLLIEAIAKLESLVVRWPTDPSQRENIRSIWSMIPLKFRLPFGIVDKLFGCIDGTFVRIWKPENNLKDKRGKKKDPQLANSYKMFYAIQNLAVCGPNHLFYFFVTGFVGSMTDSTMLPRSRLYKYIASFLPLGWYLFGDAGFGLLPWLMTPFTKAQLDKIEREKGAAARLAAWTFNEIQASLRVHIEQAFGILKNRWRIMKCLTVRYPHTKDTIMATVVLHNYLILHRDVWTVPDVEHPTPADPRDDDVVSRVEQTYGTGSLPDWADVCPSVPTRGYVPPPADTGPYFDKTAAKAKRMQLAEEWHAARDSRAP